MIEEVWKQRKKFTMSTYKINFEQLRQQPGITEMLTALERGFSDILNHYFDMHSNEIWTNHSDLFSEQGSDLRTIAARVMGREMSLIAKRNENVYSRILRILELNTTDVMKSKMADLMTTYFENTVEENVQLLIQLKKGFIE